MNSHQLARGLLILAVLAVSGCQTAGELPPSTDVSGAVALLDEISREVEPREAPIPSDVADSLVPIIGSVIDDYDPAAERFDLAVTDVSAQEFFCSTGAGHAL